MHFYKPRLNPKYDVSFRSEKRWDLFVSLCVFCSVSPLCFILALWCLFCDLRMETHTA